MSTPTEMALEACRLLVRAYNNGEVNGESIEWDEVDAAFGRAQAALISAGEDPAAYVDPCDNEETEEG